MRWTSISGTHAVFAPKAVAARHLRVSVACAPLEAFALFSSVASTFGSIGQNSYAAANACLDAMAQSVRWHGSLGSSLQIPAVGGAGMGAATFDKKQLDAIGGISLDEFAMCLSIALTSAHSVLEHTQAPLAPKLLDMLRDTVALVEIQPSVISTPTCEEEALLMREETRLPRSTGKYVRLSVAVNLWLVELNDPLHFNALSMEMASDMRAAAKWLAAQEGDSIKSMVLQAAGDHFCPGGNMYRRYASPASLAAAARASFDLFDGFYQLRTLPVPVVCAAHGSVLGGGLAICLLTDFVICNEPATFQVGERSRGIYPAGLLTHTLVDAVGAEMATELYLTEVKLTSAQACEKGLVQAVMSSVRSAQQLAYELASVYATSIDDAISALQADLHALSCDLPRLERRILAKDAFAQARSFEAKSAGGTPNSDQVVFTSSDDLLGRSRLRKVVQAVLKAAVPQGSVPTPRWRHVSYAPEDAKPCVTAEGALRQLVALLTSAPLDQQRPGADETDVQPPIEESRIEVTRFASRFTEALAERPGATPQDVLMTTYDELMHGLPVRDGGLNDAAMQGEGEPSAVDAKFPCLLLLRCSNAPAESHMPLVIAHSLLGDHKGYGRLWNCALQRMDVYALQHRGLAGLETSTLDHAGAMSMLDEYATALVAWFASSPFDLIGASFGAVLASHVLRAAHVTGGHPRRLILIDPPPAVSSELPVPKMLTSLRTAAMGVLLIHLRIEMGTSVWEQFPQLQTLPEDALADFVTAQCLPEGASRNDLAVSAERFRRLLHVYRQCRYAFHTFAVHVEAVSPHMDGSPAILMALSSERWPTFREMFPGIKDDDVDQYGLAAKLRLPGQHIAMISHCLSNRDAHFTEAVERFLGGNFCDAWWWADRLHTPRKEAGEPKGGIAPMAGVQMEALMSLLSGLSTELEGAPHREASTMCAVEVAPAVQRVAQELLPSGTSLDAPLMEAGLDSLGSVEFRSRLSSELGDVKLPETLVFDFPTLRQVEGHVGSLLAVTDTRCEHAQRAAGASVLDLLSSLVSTGTHKPAAAVSPPVSTRSIDNVVCLNAASCRAGGAICGNAALWQVGTTAYGVVSAVPSTRWDSSVESVDVRALYGAFLSQIDLFDQTAFSLPPAEADVMDPHQRIALEEGYAALSASGLNRSKLVNSITGVFGGLWPSDYATVLSKRGAVGRGPFAVAATGAAMLVGRLSYTLGMQGPCIAFDTACSASLSACHGAMDALKSRDSSAGLVFGVNVMCASDTSQLFAAAQMLSPSGKSHTFDARANGYARGEACCCAVLITETAEMRRVRCDAGAVRQDGKSASLTAPNGTAQQALIRAALTSAGRPPRGIFMLEAHGTGTRLGDPIEARAMCAVREDPRLMSVMGCKANIGHTEPQQVSPGCYNWRWP